MRPALVLIDMQNDFFDSPGLVPDKDKVIAGAAALLSVCRTARIPVFHVVMMIYPDGSNRMPHWVEKNLWKCLVGSDGASFPAALMPAPGEQIFEKSFFSAFENNDFSAALLHAGVDTLILAGLYTHACVRSTALDAYSRGFAVRIARDAIASAEPLHAEITLDYLAQRTMPSISTSEMPLLLSNSNVATIDAPIWAMRNPARWCETLDEVIISQPENIDAAMSYIHRKRARWAAVPFSKRVELLIAWDQAIRSLRSEFVSLLTQDIGKPVTYAEGEVDYALKLLAYTIETLVGQSTEGNGSGHTVYYAPVGIVGLITPWNNPLAIPIGKLAPALAWGNGALWKPALPGSRVAQLLAKTLRAALPDAPFELLIGDMTTGQRVIKHSGIDFISFTGSTRQGRAVAALCAHHGKPLQAELGGNNAVIILADANPEYVARLLAPALFGFAGQRCTAPRRLIVEKKLRPAFEHALLREIEALPVGEPTDRSVHVGPLVSLERQGEMLKIVAAAEGTLLCGGGIPPGYEHGAWFEPTLIADPSPDSQVVMEESFGPIAVLMTADDADHALVLCNAVPHGLVTTLFTDDLKVQQRIAAGAETGIVVFNAVPAPIDPAAPFLGWKESGIGPPEHGRWDREFYSRPKVVYQQQGV